ncbi:MAG: hypothetical protein JW893_03935 [Candidatus Omnitrophica bacterium]|nr:hypothetical protein [Candidatus Omnitrophota bacterium]
MNCEEVKSKIYSFLEDSMAESLRQSVRDHLICCPQCRDYGESLQTLANDIGKLFQGDLPPAFVDTLRGEIERHQEKRALVRTGLRIGLSAAGLLLLLYAVWAGVSQLSAKTKLEAEEVQRALRSKAAEGTLLELERMDAILKRSMGEETAKDRGSAHLPSVIQLKPFHWDLVLKTESQREFLRNQISSLQGEMEYQSSPLLILHLEFSELKTLMNILAGFPSVNRTGPPLTPSQLPESEKPIRVSLWMDTEEFSKSEILYQHWHFSFLMKNSFSFLNELKALGLRIVHEAPDLWVIELAGADWDLLQKLIENFPGLVVNDYTDQKLGDLDPNAMIRVVIYIEEG